MAKNNRRIVRLTDVKKCGKLQCTHREAAALLDIRQNTFRRLLTDDPKVRKAWEQGKALGCISLRRKQMRLAGQSATMAIFMGKQILGQRDLQNLSVTGGDGEPLDLSDLSKDERDKLRKLITRGESNKDSDPE